MNIIDIIMKNTFETANEAYEYMHNEIITNGIDFANTKALFNIGFTIENPTNKVITNKERNWNEEYAAAEWAWYLSGDPRVTTLGKIYGKIWQTKMVKSTLTMVISGKEKISLKMLFTC